MSDFNTFLREQPKGESFKKKYDVFEPEYAIVCAMIDARRESVITQNELSLRTDIPQADISRLENGNANPSLRTLQRFADGMGMKLRLEFVPTNR